MKLQSGFSVRPGLSDERDNLHRYAMALTIRKGLFVRRKAEPHSDDQQQRREQAPR
jgi:hypothetical protein